MQDELLDLLRFACPDDGSLLDDLGTSAKDNCNHGKYSLSFKLPHANSTFSGMCADRIEAISPERCQIPARIGADKTRPAGYEYFFYLHA